MAYLHCTPAVWQRPQIGRFSSHFWRRALHLVQPVNDLDMSVSAWGGSEVDVGVEWREENLRGIWRFQSRVAKLSSGET